MLYTSHIFRYNFWDGFWPEFLEHILPIVVYKREKRDLGTTYLMLASHFLVSISRDRVLEGFQAKFRIF